MVNSGFWLKMTCIALGRPCYVLAPMADVTDAAFRRVINKYGKPDVLWTEFVSADGLVRATEEGKKKLMRDLVFEKGEHPIVAQLFGSNPEYMRQAAKLCADLGFDGIDINMGCPDRSIEKQGCGAAMMKNPVKAREIIRAAKEGAIRDDGTVLPISIKTRIGYNKNELETWLPELLAEEPALITIHARTRKEMSAVPARWEYVARAVEIRNEIQRVDIDARKPYTLIFGNGDAFDLEDARKKAELTNADGVMLGRAIFGNPWLFKESYIPAVEEKLRVMVEHTKAFAELLGDIKNFAIMKKHYKAYVNGFDGAKELRMELMAAETAERVEELVKGFLKNSVDISIL
ncbi:MAG: tRNA-dihydrouridine synthase [Patescibacteria group bacterium]